jgi:hypothetical protein
MIANRHSSASKANPNLKKKQGNLTNSEFLSTATVKEGSILLLGGSSLAHFRIRVAQSHLKHDMVPSCWSLAAIILSKDKFVTVPLDLHQNVSEVPSTNGIMSCQMSDYDNPKLFPNIAVLEFSTNHKEILEKVETLKMGRSGIVDLPGLMIPWIGFMWGVGRQGNPLFEECGLPSATFVESVYSLVGTELTPGLSSRSSCPEAIWQGAKWWHDYYKTAAMAPPKGTFVIRQPNAAMLEDVLNCH